MTTPSIPDQVAAVAAAVAALTVQLDQLDSRTVAVEDRLAAVERSVWALAHGRPDLVR